MYNDYLKGVVNGYQACAFEKLAENATQSDPEQELIDSAYRAIRNPILAGVGTGLVSSAGLGAGAGALLSQPGKRWKGALIGGVAGPLAYAAVTQLSALAAVAAGISSTKKFADVLKKQNINIQ